MKIVSILGARPQFIKAGTVSREIDRQRKKGVNIKEIIVHTGQHYDANMSHIFFDEMRIPKPDYFLGIGGQSHGAMTGQMIEKIEEVLRKEKPDMVLVYGDTNSTLSGAIAASKLQIPIAHIEAGLRSFNMEMPEEINRILTDRISSLLFCPTQRALDNLTSESIGNWRTNAKMILSGDVMQDGADFYGPLAKPPKELVRDNNEFILATVHRAENTDSPERLAAIVSALNLIAKNTNVVLPLHPRTKKILSTLDLKLKGVKVIEPVGYLNMIWLIKNCQLVLTDSGGLQKEAFFFHKPCVTLRDETEWGELIDIGVNFLVGADKGKIMSAIGKGLELNISDSPNLYGGGQASAKIVSELIEWS